MTSVVMLVFGVAFLCLGAGTAILVRRSALAGVDTFDGVVTMVVLTACGGRIDCAVEGDGVSMVRRAILQGLAGLPFAAPALAGSAEMMAREALAKQASFGEVSGSIGPANPINPTHPLIKQYGEEAYRALRESRELLERDLAVRGYIRGQGQVDPDLRSMRSLSASYREMKQRERDMEANELMARVRRALEW